MATREAHGGGGEGRGGAHRSGAGAPEHAAPVHVSAVRSYVLILLALLVLTGTTVAVAFQDLGVLNDVAALTIAVTKMMLVVLFFMHAKYSTRLTKIVIVSGIGWMLILIGFTLSDYMSRGWLGVPGK
jgi:cytochrome c oxidase subunit IV